MAAKDRKISLKVKWFIAILIILGLIFVTFSFAKYVEDEKSKGSSSKTKWGVTLRDVTSNDKFILSESSFNEDKHSLSLAVEGFAEAPLPGSTESFRYPDFSGVAEKDLYVTYDVDVSFVNNSFVKDGHFDCPLIIEFENKYINKKNTFNGKEYFDRKTKFQNDILDGTNILKNIKIPAGTNIDKFMSDYSKKIVATTTSPESFVIKGYENTKAILKYNFCVSDEEM